jgi:hypothetical protein
VTTLLAAPADASAAAAPMTLPRWPGIGRGRGVRTDAAQVAGRVIV